MDELDETAGADRIDPVRTALLGVAAIALGTLFLLLLIGDQVSAVSF